jgi:hypothetical protein
VRNIPPKDLDNEIIKMVLGEKTPDGFVKASTPEKLAPGSPVFGVNTPYVKD